jgi:hypothetical protein
MQSLSLSARLVMHGSAGRTVHGMLVVVVGVMALAAAPGEAQTIVGGGQEVQERLEPHRGDALTVCVHAGPGVGRGKRVVVDYPGGRVAVSTADAEEGTSCATFTAPEGDVSIRLEYQRLGVFSVRLAVRAFTTGHLRGKVLSYRWIRG